MEKIAFIGGYDKADMLIYIAKTLTIMGKKVLIMDTTVPQKTRYIVPAMQTPKRYITTFENVDIAIGFETFSQIKAYSHLGKEDQLEYDYALVDIDSYRGFYYSQIKTTDKMYFVTSYDLYSIRRGLQVFRKLTQPVEVTRVLITKDMMREELEYLNHITKGYKIKWSNDIVYIPFSTEDLNAIFSNQRSGRIQIRGLSSSYIDAITYLVEGIAGENKGQVKKAIKVLEKK